MKQKLWFARLIGIGMFLTVLSLNIFAQGNGLAQWDKIGPYGGDIRDIKMKIIDSLAKKLSNWTKKDSVVIASYGAGVFINDSNATGSWLPRNIGLPNRKVLSLGLRKADYGDTMYVGMDGNGIYRTYNAGLTWEAANGSGAVNSVATRKVYTIAIHPNQSWKLIIATDLGLWKSDNCGATWTQLNSTLPTTQMFTDIQWHEYSTGKVWASSAGSVYYSNDEGATWWGYAVNTATINCLALASSAFDTLFCGMQDGKIYEVTFPPPSYAFTKRVIRNAAMPVFSIAIGPKIDLSDGFFNTICATDTLYVGTKYGFFKGTKQVDNNYAWVQVNNGLYSYSSPGSGNSLINFVTYYPGRNYDTTGPQTLVQKPFLFIGTGFNGFFKAPNNQPGGGTQFSATNTNLPVGGIKAVSVTTQSSDILYAGGGIDLGSGLGNGALWKSTNASTTGAVPPVVTWTRVFPVEDSATIGYMITSIVNSYFSNEYTLFADSLKGIYKTTNGGTSWTLVYSGTGVNYLHIPRYIKTPPTTDIEKVYASQRTNGQWQILKSTNGGSSFTALSTKFNYPIMSLMSDSSASQYVYVCTWGGGVYRSTDAGTSFTQITTSNGVFNINVYALAVFNDSTKLVISTEYGTYKSDDRGVTWLDDNSYLTGGLDKATDIFKAGDTLWTSLSGTGIYHRATGSASWTQSNSRYLTIPATKLPYDTLQLKDIDFIWEWDGGTTIAGFAASDVFGAMRRLGANAAISNSTGITGDSVYVYFADTSSVLRDFTHGADSLAFLTVRIINAAKIDSFYISIKAPTNYFSRVDTTITDGTVTSGWNWSRTKSSADTWRWKFGSTNQTKIGTNSDVALFTIRYSFVDNNTSRYLKDSLPGTSLSDSCINIVHAKSYLYNAGTPTIHRDSATVFISSPVDTISAHFGNSKDIWDSVAVFWFRKIPAGLNGQSYFSDNSLPGNSGTEISDSISYRGDMSIRYDSLTYFMLGTTSKTNPNLKTDHDWVYTRNTGKSMIVRVPASANPTYPYLTWSGLPEKSIRTGDAIGAFYYLNDTLVCAGWGIWDATYGCTFTLWGDDDRTPLKDGFVLNEQLNFKVYDSRYKKVYSVPDKFVTAAASKIFIPGQILEVTTKFQGKLLNDMAINTTGPNSMTNQTVGGWHLISSYIDPVNPNTAVNDIWKNFRYFLLMKDQTPNIYWPSIGLDQIVNWDVNKAYWIYMSRSDTNSRFTGGTQLGGARTVIFRGTKVDITTPISLTAGWNLVPYFGNTSYSIASALSAITGKFDLVTDDSGLIYWPSAGVNQINTMNPGKGYQIYMNASVPTATLTYPSEVLTSTRSFGFGGRIPEITESESSSEPHFLSARTSPVSQVIGIKVDGLTLRNGDEIGVFTKDGICVGSAVYQKNGKNQMAVTVFGNDEMSSKDIKTGAFEGEELTFKVFTKADCKENKADIKGINWIVGTAKGVVFKANSIAKVDLSLLGKIVPTEYALDQNYPNPFNPSTIIRYALPEDGFVRIKIYDLLGREVKSLVSDQQIAGYYTIEWDGKNNHGMNVSTGMYLYKIEANNFKKSLKMMLMK